MAVYKGSLSDFDILLRYRQKDNDEKWSRIRTPKHIHWTVDILMKLQQNKRLTKSFLAFMLNEWNSTEPIDSEEKRQSLDLKELLYLSREEIRRFENLSKVGEYSIKFLILLAKLLMLQEKTNRRDAYMFKKLLESIEKGKDLFQIISSASFTGFRVFVSAKGDVKSTFFVKLIETILLTLFSNN